MKVFLSWSGGLSEQVATALRAWLPNVIQGLDTWVSSQDIPVGDQWAESLLNALQGADFGIICAVPGNLSKPYLNFEAGALSAGMVGRPVTALLIGLAPEDARNGPLQMFQLVSYSKGGVRKLVESLNMRNPRGSLPESILEATFEKWWPDLCEKLDPLAEAAREFAQEEDVLSRVRSGIDQGIIGWRKNKIVVTTEAFREIAQHLDRVKLTEEGVAFFTAAAIHYGEALDIVAELSPKHPATIARALTTMVSSYPHVRGIWRAAAALEDLPQDVVEAACRNVGNLDRLDEERRYLLLEVVPKRGMVAYLKQVYRTAGDDRVSMARQVLRQLKELLGK